MFLAARHPERGGCEGNQLKDIGSEPPDLSGQAGAELEGSALAHPWHSPADLPATNPSPLLVGAFDIGQQRNGYGEALSVACRVSVCEVVLYFVE